MAWSFSQDRPVYIQISERITISVLSGKYALSEQIPSVRQLALEAAVNPNTVQHAFSELENEGIIISKGTLGRYVTDSAEVVEKCRKKLAKQWVSELVSKAGELSVSRRELITMIEEEEL